MVGALLTGHLALLSLAAAAAILEAVGDWLDSHDPTRDGGVPSVSAEDADGADPSGVALDRLGRHIRARSSDQAPRSVTEAFAPALNHWSGAAAAEHHQSNGGRVATTSDPLRAHPVREQHLSNS